MYGSGHDEKAHDVHERTFFRSKRMKRGLLRYLT